MKIEGESKVFIEMMSFISVVDTKKQLGSQPGGRSVGLRVGLKFVFPFGLHSRGASHSGKGFALGFYGAEGGRVKDCDIKGGD